MPETRGGRHCDDPRLPLQRVRELEDTEVVAGAANDLEPTSPTGRPTGSPSGVAPTGTEIAGAPKSETQAQDAIHSV